MPIFFIVCSVTFWASWVARLAVLASLRGFHSLGAGQVSQRLMRSIEGVSISSVFGTPASRELSSLIDLVIEYFSAWKPQSLRIWTGGHYSC